MDGAWRRAVEGRKQLFLWVIESSETRQVLILVWSPDSELTKQKFRENPEYYLHYIKAIDAELTQRFRLYLNGTPEFMGGIEVSRPVSSKVLCLMRITENERINDQKASEQAWVDWPPDSKRLWHWLPQSNSRRWWGIFCVLDLNDSLTAGTGFLEALAQDKVSVLTDNIREITEDGFIDHLGKQHQVDVIVYATGYVTCVLLYPAFYLPDPRFDTSFTSRFPITVPAREKVEDDNPDRSLLFYYGLTKRKYQVATAKVRQTNSIMKPTFPTTSSITLRMLLLVSW